MYQMNEWRARDYSPQVLAVDLGVYEGYLGANLAFWVWEDGVGRRRDRMTISGSAYGIATCLFNLVARL